MSKWGYDYLDLAGYIHAKGTEYLQSDLTGINDLGYTNLTPYIVDKVKEMFQ